MLAEAQNQKILNAIHGKQAFSRFLRELHLIQSLNHASVTLQCILLANTPAPIKEHLDRLRALQRILATEKWR